MRFFTPSIAAGAVFLASAAWAQPVEQNSAKLISGRTHASPGLNLDPRLIYAAARASMQERAAGGGGGGLATILADHVKYVSNPASAKDPIPPEEDNAAREAHRSVHAALFDAIGGGGGAGGQKGAVGGAAGAGAAAGAGGRGGGKGKAAGDKGAKEQ
ncbi:hypothetical protein E5D57_000486 [Metarhizium anisopliae]|nr:hypothetical protein E5D57_000486 [Metarhizium anisopliae]